MRIVVWGILLILAGCAIVTVNTGQGRTDAPAVMRVEIAPDITKDTVREQAHDDDKQRTD